jgi:hypothetical protein
MIKTLVNSYKNAEKAIHNFFGFTEDWRVLPIEDATDVYWYVDSGEVMYSNSKEKLAAYMAGDDEGDEIYGGEQYHGIRIDKEGSTLIGLNTQCDGNVFLMVFDSTKEIKRES